MAGPAHTDDPLKVFVSYTHDSTEHSERALAMSNALREAGFDCDIDQYHANQDWPLWMEKGIENADRVLVICTETYLRRWKNDEEPGKGLGAQWESLLTRQHLYENPGNIDKFIPVVFESTNLQHIPKPLGNVSYSNVGSTLERFEDLRKRVLGIPPAEKPPIRTSLSPIPVADGFFTRSQDTEGAGHSAQDLGLHEESEELYTNLFPIDYPDKIYTAKATKVKDAGKFVQGFRETWRALGNMTPAPVNFWLERGTIYSFSQFDTPIWRELSRAKEVVPKGFIPSDSWAQADNGADKNRFIRLLGVALDHYCENNGTQYRMTYARKMRCHLFTRNRNKEQVEGKLKTLAVKSHAARTVFKAIPDKISEEPGAIQHWKHVAFRHRFIRIEGVWHLVLTPFWAFTSDGFYQPSRWQKKSSANMQKPEKNRAVMGHVQFWASVLCRDEDMLDECDEFCIRRPGLLQVTPSIRDDDWKNIAGEKEKAEFKEEDTLL